MTTHQPFIHNDSDGNSLTFHGGAQDDGNDAVAIEVEQIGRGSAWVHVRHTAAARVADELRAAAGLPPVDRAAVLRKAADMAEQTFIHGVTPAAREHDEIWDQAVRAVATMLRGHADEVQPTTGAGCSLCGHRACMGRGRCGVVMTSEAGIVRPPCQCLGAPVAQQPAAEEA